MFATSKLVPYNVQGLLNIQAEDEIIHLITQMITYSYNHVI